METKHRRTAGILLAILLLAFTRLSAEEAAAPDLAPGSYDPKLLMPLALGNSWTYRWSSPAAPTATQQDEGDAPLFMCVRWYTYDGKSVLATSRQFRATPHEETYTVVRKDGPHHFFTIASEPSVSPGQIRDGRFGDAVENCWTWWESDSAVGLTESIKRNWGPHGKHLLGDRVAPAQGLPSDHRNAIHIDRKKGKWGKTWVEFTYYNNPCRRAYKTTDTEIVVPAGKFKNCIESIEKVHEDDKKDSPLLWETHTFFAPTVGMVHEYQSLPDGTRTYQLDLLRFTPARLPEDDHAKEADLPLPNPPPNRETTP